MSAEWLFSANPLPELVEAVAVLDLALVEDGLLDLDLLVQQCRRVEPGKYFKHTS